MQAYIYIEWPESQNYMELDWFNNEAILDNSNDAPSSSYLIPEERYMEVLANSVNTNTEKNSTLDNSITPLHSYIIQRVTELATAFPTTKEDEEYIGEEWEAKDGYDPFMGGMSISEAIIHIKITDVDEKEQLKRLLNKRNKPKEG